MGVEFEIPLLDLPLHIIDKYRDMTSGGKLWELGSEQRIETPRCGLQHRPKIDLSPKAA